MIKCLIDNTEHDSVESLHKHLRKFRVKQSDYYQEYYPRYDLLTNEKIPFKTHDQYFAQHFINKNNLKKWIKQNPEKGKEWAIDWLRNRKAEKNLLYAPSQVELKSLSVPTIHYYNEIGGYEKICKELGFAKRYENELLKLDKCIKNFEIKIDTREQNPLSFACKTTVEGLKIGDYALDDKNDKKVYIERKSLNDFAGTMSAGYERFCKELDRAVKSDAYIVMLVEEKISHALSFDYLPHMRWVKAKPSHVFKQLRTLLEKYPNHFQCLFVDNRREAADLVVKILMLGELVKLVDLQYKYETGELLNVG